MNKILKIICLVLIIFFVFILKANSYKVRFAQEYKSYDELNNAYKKALKGKDTLTALSRLIELSDHDRDKGDYDLAFEKLWKAKFIAEKQKQAKTLIVINRDLGLLYDLYGKDSIALDHLYSSIILAKKIMDEDRSVREQLISNYYCVSNFWRDRGIYNISMTYLDSCVSLSSKKNLFLLFGQIWDFVILK